ncbi:MAG TPA: hypothetical protein VGE74_28970 [Gemmata sp.]
MARDTLVWLTGALWLFVVSAGFWAWERYEVTAGPVRAPEGAAPAPPNERAPAGWRLTVFVHPHCPCSRASLGELGALARAVPDLAVRVLFVLPWGTEPGWVAGESWDLVARVPGAARGVDRGGSEARRLGAETSGHAVLTDPMGRIAFRGGLTRARGRVGESPGTRAVQDWVRGSTGAPTSPVFGCPLLAPDA